MPCGNQANQKMRSSWLQQSAEFWILGCRKDWLLQSWMWKWSESPAAAVSSASQTTNLVPIVWKTFSQVFQPFPRYLPNFLCFCDKLFPDKAAGWASWEGLAVSSRSSACEIMGSTSWTSSPKQTSSSNSMLTSSSHETSHELWTCTGGTAATFGGEAAAGWGLRTSGSLFIRNYFQQMCATKLNHVFLKDFFWQQALQFRTKHRQHNRDFGSFVSLTR